MPVVNGRVVELDSDGNALIELFQEDGSSDGVVCLYGRMDVTEVARRLNQIPDRSEGAGAFGVIEKNEVFCLKVPQDLAKYSDDDDVAMLKDNNIRLEYSDGGYSFKKSQTHELSHVRSSSSAEARKEDARGQMDTALQRLRQWMAHVVEECSMYSVLERETVEVLVAKVPNIIRDRLLPLEVEALQTVLRELVSAAERSIIEISKPMNDQGENVALNRVVHLMQLLEEAQGAAENLPSIEREVIAEKLHAHPDIAPKWEDLQKAQAAARSSSEPLAQVQAQELRAVSAYCQALNELIKPGVLLIGQPGHIRQEFISEKSKVDPRISAESSSEFQQAKLERLQEIHGKVNFIKEQTEQYTDRPNNTANALLTEIDSEIKKAKEAKARAEQLMALREESFEAVNASIEKIPESIILGECLEFQLDKVGGDTVSTDQRTQQIEAKLAADTSTILIYRNDTQEHCINVTQTERGLCVKPMGSTDEAKKIALHVALKASGIENTVIIKTGEMQIFKKEQAYRKEVQFVYDNGGKVLKDEMASPDDQAMQQQVIDDVIAARTEARTESCVFRTAHRAEHLARSHPVSVGTSHSAASTTSPENDH